MNTHLVKHFFKFIFFNKTRQRLLFVAIFGVVISTFSLLVLQATMRGLQKNVMQRSMNHHGHGVIRITKDLSDNLPELVKFFTDNNTLTTKEYEIELMIKAQNNIRPAIIHGIDKNHSLPIFLSNLNNEGIVLGSDLSYQLGLTPYEKILLVSPAHVDDIVDDLPRFASSEITDRVISYVEDIDQFHGWVDINVIHQIIREKSFNRLRIFSEYSHLKESFAEQFPGVKIISWREQNKNLAHSLDLENTVMIFLFVSMTLLVAVAITCGFTIFFDNIKNDLVCFWVLGADSKQLDVSTKIFILVLSFATVFIGGSAGLLVVKLLDRYSGDLLPEVFVDRNLPVHLTFQSVMIAVVVPFCITLVFALWALRNFHKDRAKYSTQIRNLA